MKRFSSVTRPSLVARPQSFQTTWAVFWVAFLMRLLLMTATHVYRSLLDKYPDHRSLGWEMGRIAHALVTGRGYADPFLGHTGPTAWVAPLYPWLMAGVFRIFGDYSLLSAWALLALNCFFFALITRAVYEIAARSFSRRTAAWSAWIWAFYPSAVLFVVWETVLSTWLLSCVFVLALRMRNIGEGGGDQGVPRNGAAERSDPDRADLDRADLDRADSGSLRRWLLFGFLWALVALSNPALLIFLPAAGIWILSGSLNLPKMHRRTQVRFAVASALLFVVCLSPWMARNWMAFHRFVPMRTNFGAELYLGNGPGARGFSMMREQPSESAEQFHLYRQMGEVNYSAMRGEMAGKYIESDPWHFVRNTLRRVAYFWVGAPVRFNGRRFSQAHQLEYAARYPFVGIAGLLGLALVLKRRVPGYRLFGWAFLLIPLIYYFVAVDERFRFPLDPLIVIFGVYWFEWLGHLLWSRLGAGGALL